MPIFYLYDQLITITHYSNMLCAHITTINKKQTFLMNTSQSTFEIVIINVNCYNLKCNFSVYLKF